MAILNEEQTAKLKAMAPKSPPDAKEVLRLIGARLRNTRTSNAKFERLLELYNQEKARNHRKLPRKVKRKKVQEEPKPAEAIESIDDLVRKIEAGNRG